jgi:hypothetical protein
MIEKKTMWAVTRELNVKPQTAIVEDGRILVTKNSNGKEEDYSGSLYGILQLFDTEEDAKEYVKGEKQALLDMVPKVRKFITRLDYNYTLRKNLGIEKKEYLGNYAQTNDDGYIKSYNNECAYAEKLETFIKSRMLNIDGWMIPISEVRDIQWFGWDGAEDFEPEQWKALLTLASGEKLSTDSVEDVRLLWATIGKCSGSWFVDNDINYDNDNDEDEDE